MFTTEQQRQFAIYQRELLCWNEKMNLTGLVTEKEIMIKHFYDSLLGQQVYPWQGKEKVLDMGSGAGFPGIPLKIIYPELVLTLLDSLQKRVQFLQHLQQTLSLTNTEIIHGRAEEWGQRPEYRGKFELVLSRAVARLPVLAEYCLPFVRKGGTFLAYKGKNGVRESEEAQQSIARLGGKVVDLKHFQLPQQMGERIIVVVRKIAPTPPGYPRRPGIPERQPL